MVCLLSPVQEGADVLGWKKTADGLKKLLKDAENDGKLVCVLCDKVVKVDCDSKILHVRPMQVLNISQSISRS